VPLTGLTFITTAHMSWRRDKPSGRAALLGHHQSSGRATISAMLGSVAWLAVAVRAIPLSTAYPIWTGIGAVGVFLNGVAILGEQATAARVMAATFIVAGLVMMR
jgi:multidrug transporter EmrE-like cation transporter